MTDTMTSDELISELCNAAEIVPGYIDHVYGSKFAALYAKAADLIARLSADKAMEPVVWRIDHPNYVGIYAPRFTASIPHEDQLDGMLVTPLYAPPPGMEELREAVKRLTIERDNASKLFVETAQERDDLYAKLHEAEQRLAAPQNASTTP